MESNTTSTRREISRLLLYFQRWSSDYSEIHNSSPLTPYTVSALCPPFPVTSLRAMFS